MLPRNLFIEVVKMKEYTHINTFEIDYLITF